MRIYRHPSMLTRLRMRIRILRMVRILWIPALIGLIGIVALCIIQHTLATRAYTHTMMLALDEVTREIEANRLDLAEKRVNDALQSHPEEIPLLELQATIYEKQRNWTNAAQAYAHLNYLSPNLKYRLSRIRAIALTDEIGDLSGIISANANDITTNQIGLLAYINYHRNFMRASTQLLERLPSTNNYVLLIGALKQVHFNEQQSTETFQRLSESVDPVVALLAQKQLVAIKMKHQDYAGALVIIDKIHELSPQIADLMGAHLCSDKNDLDLARTYYKHAFKHSIDTNNARLYAELLYEHSDPPSAFTDLANNLESKVKESHLTVKYIRALGILRSDDPSEGYAILRSIHGKIPFTIYNAPIFLRANIAGDVFLAVLEDLHHILSLTGLQDSMQSFLPEIYAYIHQLVMLNRTDDAVRLAETLGLKYIADASIADLLLENLNNRDTLTFNILDRFTQKFPDDRNLLSIGYRLALKTNDGSRAVAYADDMYIPGDMLSELRICQALRFSHRFSELDKRFLMRVREKNLPREILNYTFEFAINERRLELLNALQDEPNLSSISRRLAEVYYTYYTQGVPPTQKIIEGFSLESIDPKEDGEELFALSGIAIACNMPKAALKILDYIPSTFRDSIGLQVRRADVNLLLGHTEDALKIAESTFKQAPDNPTARECYGTILTHLGLFYQAAEILRPLLDAAPTENVLSAWQEATCKLIEESISKGHPVSARKSLDEFRHYFPTSKLVDEYRRRILALQNNLGTL